MKSNIAGTMAEQRRWQVRWLGASVRQSDPSYVPDRRCRSCRHCSKLVDYRCQRHRFTTQANAVCPDWHRSPLA